MKNQIVYQLSLLTWQSGEVAQTQNLNQTSDIISTVFIGQFRHKILNQASDIISTVFIDLAIRRSSSDSKSTINCLSIWQSGEVVLTQNLKSDSISTALITY